MSESVRTKKALMSSKPHPRQRVQASAMTRCCGSRISNAASVAPARGSAYARAKDLRALLPAMSPSAASVIASAADTAGSPGYRGRRGRGSLPRWRRGDARWCSSIERLELVERAVRDEIGAVGAGFRRIGARRAPAGRDEAARRRLHDALKAITAAQTVSLGCKCPACRCMRLSVQA